MGRPIYVELLIRAPIDEVWAKTQEPDQHQRWDLRFSSIEYIPPQGENEPQRFLYSTRLGFGLVISGEGETVGETNSSDGSRTSALRFWSDDSRALILEGSGYWKYIDGPDGVRFITGYDYRTRFGLSGRIFDRFVFRPLIGWATAWSFDRLRLWLEEGIEPEAARRRLLPRARHCLRRAR